MCLLEELCALRCGWHCLLCCKRCIVAPVIVVIRLVLLGTWKPSITSVPKGLAYA